MILPKWKSLKLQCGKCASVVSETIETQNLFVVSFKTRKKKGKNNNEKQKK